MDPGPSIVVPSLVHRTEKNWWTKPDHNQLQPDFQSRSIPVIDFHGYGPAGWPNQVILSKTSHDQSRTEPSVHA